MGLAEVAAYRLVVLFKAMKLSQNSQRYHKAKKKNTYAASDPCQVNTWLLVPMRHPSNKKAVRDEHTTGWRHTRRIGHMLHIWRHICSRRAWRRHPRHHWLSDKVVQTINPKEEKRRDHPQEVGIHKEDKHTRIHASQLLELPNLLHKTEAEWVGGREPPYAPVAAQAGVVELKTST